MCVFTVFKCIPLPVTNLVVLSEGSSVPMPPELMELYQLYQQEIASRNEKEANYLTELNVMLRVRCWEEAEDDRNTVSVPVHVVTARPGV